MPVHTNENINIILHSKKLPFKCRWNGKTWSRKN